MEFLVFGTEMIQDVNGFRHAGRLHHNLLEAAVQGAVLFHNLGEFVQRSGPYALEFPTGQSGLEHVGGIQAAGSAAGTHDGMELVNEQDDIGVLAGLFDNGLEALLKISPVLGPRHHGRNVQRQDALLGQGGRYVAASYLLGNTLYNGRFTHAGLPYEHRIVLLPSAQYFYDAGNLAVPAHYRIQLALSGSAGEVVGKFFNIQFLFFRLFFRPLGGLFLLVLQRGTQQPLVFHEGQQAAVVDAVVAQINLAVALGGAAKGQQQVLGLSQGALEAGGLHHSDAEHILRLAGESDMVQLLVGKRLSGDDALVYEGLQIGRFHPQTLQGAEGGVLFLTDDSQEKMIRADAVTACAHGLFASVFDNEVKVLRNL